MNVSTEQIQSRTKFVLILAGILQEPLSCLNALLPLLIIKQLNATALHISALTALSPTISILSFYWGFFLDLKSSPRLIRHNLVLATLLTACLFILSPVSDNPWFFVLAGTSYILFMRAANPARMELLKRNIHSEQREKLYSQTFKISYATGMVLGPLLGLLIDQRPDLWKGLFVLASLLYLLSGWLYNHIPILDQVSSPPSVKKKDLWKILVEPWKDSYRLLVENRTFAYFQVGFFIAGFGLMFAKPAGDLLLGSLDISYYSLFICRTFLKGIGVIGTAKFWGRHLGAHNILKTAYFVAFGFFLYNFLLMGSSMSLSMVFLAYFLYGIAQSGSHLVWNLSGPLLSGHDSSHHYSSVNILAIGIRGCVAPVLGGICASTCGLIPSLGIGGLIMLWGAWYLKKKQQQITLAYHAS